MHVFPKRQRESSVPLCLRHVQAAYADDEEVDAAGSSVGALHMNPFCSSGGGGAACAQWSRQQATAAFAMHVGNALLALGAEAGDKEHLTVVVLAMKRDGLVLPGSRQEGRPARSPVRSAVVATDECCVALAVKQAPRTGRACPSV